MLSVRVLCFGLAVPFVAAAAPGADLEKRHEAWLDEVAPLILEEEEELFRSLGSEDRDEFIAIFWKRRDPDVDTENNAFRDGYGAARAAANERFRVFGREGIATDCARAFVVLGEPDEVQRGGTRPKPGQREPETWFYRDRPGFQFEGGALEVSFDGECALPRGEDAEALRRALAESRILNPELGYRTGEDGRLVPLADLLPKATPLEQLQAAAREDFSLAGEALMTMKAEGGAYVAGLLHGRASDVSAEAEPGGTLRLAVAHRALDEKGEARVVGEREADVPVEADGGFTVSFGAAVPPGRWTLELSALNPDTGKGSVVSLPYVTEGFADGRLAAPSVLVLREIRDLAGAPDERDPLSNFAFGATQLVPRFGNRFATDEEVLFFCPYFGGGAGPGGQASVSLELSVEREGQPITQAPSQEFRTPDGVYAIGPVPLESFAPGGYTVRVVVRDALSGTELSLQEQFEVVEAAD
jgi:GWxTD domain-containing protein